jgi:hypothetical protein
MPHGPNEFRIFPVLCFIHTSFHFNGKLSGRDFLPFFRSVTNKGILWS